jgi:hypothetical protein
MNLKFLLCNRQQANASHCERSEAISNTPMAFSAHNARDCRGPSGLAMTSCGGGLLKYIVVGQAPPYHCQHELIKESLR